MDMMIPARVPVCECVTFYSHGGRGGAGSGWSGESGGDPFVERPVVPWDCVPGSTWQYTPGYRKLPNNQCLGCPFAQCQSMACPTSSTVATPTPTVSIGPTTPANGTCVQYDLCGSSFVCSQRYISGVMVTIPCTTHVQLLRHPPTAHASSIYIVVPASPVDCDSLTVPLLPCCAAHMHQHTYRCNRPQTHPLIHHRMNPQIHRRPRHPPNHL
eukprot:m.1109610 g.1109610  ORF g.1109610 m.1109610 type:complete len:213 (-) comp24353_c0_seq21:486-1124(-)